MLAARCDGEKFFANPALRMTSRAAWSTCQPLDGRAEQLKDWLNENAIARSRAAATMEKNLGFVFSGNLAPR